MPTIARNPVELAPVVMSFTIAVPPSVPSDRHNSMPAPVRFAAKNKAPPPTVSMFGELPTVPGLRSFQNAVPATVPSDRHNSLPCVVSVAAKYR